MSKIANVFRTTLAQTQKLRGRFALTTVLYTVVGLIFFAGSATATNAYITGETPKEFLARITQRANEEPKVGETAVLGVEEIEEEEEPTCAIEEVSRKCVGCYRAEVTQQKEDCTTYTEMIDDQFCVTACPQPTPAPVESQQQTPTPIPSVQEPTCVAREISRFCTACEQADVTRQREDCSTYAETVSDSSCTATCPRAEEESGDVEEESEKTALVPVSTKSLGLVYVKEEFVEAVKDLDELADEYLAKANTCFKKCQEDALKETPMTQEELDRNLEKLRKCSDGCKFYTEKNAEAVAEILALVNK